MRTIDLFAIGIQTIWGLIELFILISKRSSKNESKSNEFRFAYLMNYGCIGLGISSGIVIRITNFFGLYSYEILFPILGIILIITGSIIRINAIVTLKNAFTVNLAISDKQKLIETGIYKRIRHPAYLGGIISFWGFGVCYANIVSILIIGLPYSLYIIARIKVEEKMLIGNLEMIIF
jgi:protein-S-isoprenylcysteine O-methyltransferase